MLRFHKYRRLCCDFCIDSLLKFCLLCRQLCSLLLLQRLSYLQELCGLKSNILLLCAPQEGRKLQEIIPTVGRL